MPCQAIVMTSAQARAGKTTLAAGLARWLHLHGRTVLPLHCPRPADGQAPRAAAILAAACGVQFEPEFEDGLKRLDTLSRRAEYVVVELAAGAQWPGGPEAVLVERGAARLARSGRPLGFFPAPPAELFLPESEELAVLPPYGPGVGRRTGVVSLPHLEDFPDFALLRGMEWMTSPAPGRFGLVILPRTSAPDLDQAWMNGQGLSSWLDRQKAQGCRVVCIGGWSPQAEPLAPGALRDYRTVSLLQGFRLPPPLPPEEDLDRLAGWFERHAEMGAWRKEFL
jgi:hypothetical protein